LDVGHSLCGTVTRMFCYTVTVKYNTFQSMAKWYGTPTHSRSLAAAQD